MNIPKEIRDTLIHRCTIQDTEDSLDGNNGSFSWWYTATKDRDIVMAHCAMRQHLIDYDDAAIFIESTHDEAGWCGGEHDDKWHDQINLIIFTKKVAR